MGSCVYAGSARAGLRARLARHFRRSGKRVHWHIDYLRRRTIVVGALVWPGCDANECVLSDAIAARADASIEGFGCSDCGCASHLHVFAGCPVGLLCSIAPVGAFWVQPGRQKEKGEREVRPE
jgi:sugar fermentation stimulation protein A